MNKQVLFTGGVLALCLAASPLQAKVSAEKAAALGGDKLTCIGAERLNILANGIKPGRV